jgi:hypothetical protein
MDADHCDDAHRGSVVLRPALTVDAALLQEIHELIDHTRSAVTELLVLSERTAAVERRLQALAESRDDEEVDVMHEQSGYWGLLAAWSPLATCANIPSELRKQPPRC